MKLSNEHVFYSKCQITMDEKTLYICPVGHGTISINRIDLGVTTNLQNSSGAIYLGEVLGIIGIIRLVKRSYLLAISASSRVDTNFHIHKIDSIAIFPIQDVIANQDESHRDGQEWQWEEIYLKMLSDLFKTCNFYYSHCYDLTNSLQKNYDILNRLDQNETYRSADVRFQWNYNLLRSFNPLDQSLSKCRLPIIMGFVAERSIDNSGIYKWLLVSRRGTRRAGTRYNRRGVDDEGNVANFVETEQILLTRESQSSFVQIRGSIPLYWSQTPSYKYKPDIDIHRRDHDAAMEKHYRDLKSNYGEVSVACLIDQRGHEAEIAREFNMRMSKIQLKLNIPYHYFDFHKECSKMRWHRLNILLKDLIPDIESYGLFSAPYDRIRKANVVTAKQTGVIRSNCIDSLDRTNVVQSMIAQYVLDLQLRSLDDVPLSDFPMFEQLFKGAWADNADALSVQYAGTPALKTDFTRTGQRTYAGIARDGLNSVTRYISNNYLDNYRQDSFDLLLGNVDNYPSPSYRPINLASYSSTFPVAIVMFTLVALYVYFRHDSLRWLEN